MTLVEVMVVLAIVLVVVALLIPAIGAVRQRAAAAAASQLVSAVHAAMQVYRGEDPLRRFPPVRADRTIRLGGTADLLAVRGLAVSGAVTGPLDGGEAGLIDPWKQPVLYHLDAHTTGDGVAVMPADAAGDPVRVPGDVDDWNPARGQPARQAVPFAYVWSWGRPTAGHDLRANAVRWIYVRQGAAIP